MSITKFLIALLAFVEILMIGCSDEPQLPVTPIDQGTLNKVTIINITALSYPTAIIDPGEQHIADGNLIGRNVIIAVRWDSENDFVDANGILTLNYNVDAITNEGQWWGTLTLTPDEPAIGGEWDITWNGRSTKTGESEWTLPLHMVGHGIGGSIDGMHLQVTNTVVYHQPFGFWLGNVDGFIKYNSK
jgi:hypothetical protein